MWNKTTGVTHQVAQLLRPVVEAMGYELWGVEYLRSGAQRILRIYIESEQGIALEDCVAVNAQVGPALDVEDIIAQEYSLEISSPGLERPLFTLEQCQRYVGETLYVLCARPVAERRKYKAKLLSVSEQALVLSAEPVLTKKQQRSGKKIKADLKQASESLLSEQSVTLPVTLIEKVVLLPEF